MNARSAALRSAAGVLALLATVAATSYGEHPRRDLDVAVVAVATPAEPSATDDALEVARLGGGGVTVQSTSTATSDCPACSASGSGVTVVYVGRGGAVRADNVAHAWSTCDGCTSSAVSVQVVVLRHVGTVHATNRAFAANVACTRCTTSAVAYQLVVAAPDGASFDRSSLAELGRWARDQVAEPTAGRALRRATPPASDHERLAELEAQAAAALGRVTRVHADVDAFAAPD